MRLRFWRHSDIEGDALDPELLSLFREAVRLPEPGTAELARGRALVANQLVDDTPRSGGRFGRRLAWGTAGGGGMWAALLGTAAANKVVAAAVGLSVLLAGGVTTAEVTGVGPSVLEALGIEQAAAPGEGGDHAAEQAAIPDSEAAPDGLPGRLVTQLHDDGSFQLRGTLIEGLAVLTASGDELAFDFDDAAIQVPGRREGDEPQSVDASALSDFVGSLAFVTGTCAEGDEVVTADCTVELVSVLGFAGQDARPDEPGQPDGAGVPEDVELPEAAQVPEDAGAPDDPGQPADLPPVDAGQPDDVPPAAAGQPDDVPPADAGQPGAPGEPDSPPPVTTPERRP